MDALVKEAEKFKYTSFAYESPENPFKVIHSANYIIAAEEYQNVARCFWACNSLSNLIEGINELSKEITDCEIMLEFIPPEFTEGFEKANFSITSEWIDFWLEDLQSLNWDTSAAVEIRPLSIEESQAAADVTKSCRGVSRGFYGEEPEFIREWLEGEENEIFAAVKNDIIIGICMMSIYQGSRGKVAWLRELAVKPEYQHQGIGRSLAGAGLEWGRDRGAELSFLATDVQNTHSINLYKKLGYAPKDGRGQINMSKKI